MSEYKFAVESIAALVTQGPAVGVRVLWEGKDVQTEKTESEYIAEGYFVLTDQELTDACERYRKAHPEKRKYYLVGNDGKADVAYFFNDDEAWEEAHNQDRKAYNEQGEAIFRLYVCRPETPEEMTKRLVREREEKNRKEGAKCWWLSSLQS